MQPVLDIGGVARFPPFAVVDDVDAGLGLLRDGFVHRQAHALVERGDVHGSSVFPRPHHLFQIVGPREAADVRGEKSAM